MTVGITKLISRILLVITATLGVSCGNMIDTVSLFNNEEMADFSKTGDLTKKSLAPYQHENILVTASLGRDGDGVDLKLKLWVGFYTKYEGEIVSLKFVEFANGNTVLNAGFDEVYKLDDPYKGNLRARITVFDGIQPSFFGEEQDEFPVRVTFEVNSVLVTKEIIITRKRLLVPIH